MPLDVDLPTLRPYTQVLCPIRSSDLRQTAVKRSNNKNKKNKTNKQKKSLEITLRTDYNRDIFVLVKAFRIQSLWRNRLARSAVNRKVGGSSPPRDGKFFFQNSNC